MDLKRTKKKIQTTGRYRSELGIGMPRNERKGLTVVLPFLPYAMNLIATNKFKDMHHKPHNQSMPYLLSQSTGIIVKQYHKRRKKKVFSNLTKADT